jgi:peptide deformylase
MPIKPDQLRIIHYPAPILRQVAKPIQGDLGKPGDLGGAGGPGAVTDEVRRVAQRMIELMHQARGVGLAAPQVGLPWRLFVSNPTGEPGDDRVFINPTLCNPSNQTETREEGCLSLPNVTGEITRPLSITIRALNEQGQPFELTSDELPARIWQHETDHLDGILILDRMPAIDKVANKQAVLDLEQAATG